MWGGVVEGEEILLYLCGCRFECGHPLATGLRWILLRWASTSLLAPGGFLRNLFLEEYTGEMP